MPTKAELQSENARLRATLATLTARDGEPTVNRPALIAQYIRDRHDVAAMPQEHFFAVILNTRQKPVAVVTVAIGSVASVDVHPRDVFREAITRNAHSIVLAHNHPSGDTAPSSADIDLTRRMVEAGRLLGIPVLDHVIVAADDHCSLAVLGIIG